MSPAPTRRPNILFLFSDEHSFRFMGHRAAADGGEVVDTPTFDWLAAQGTEFAEAYCQMPLCTPSRMCLLSGRQVARCGAWSNGSVLRPELMTMPKAFNAAGYTTCLVGKMHFGGSLQYHGFQHRPYGDITGDTGHQWEPINEAKDGGMRGRTAVSVGVTQIPESQLQDQVVAHETVAFLREQQAADPARPWFLMASFSRPHFPLTAPRRWIDRYWPDHTPEPPVGPSGDAYDHPMSAGMRKGFQTEAIGYDEMMYARAGYFACVSYLDEVLGDLFARLQASGLLDDTIIVYTSDHGEMAGEHGTWWKNGWYEACTHVPLLISTPAQRRGEAPTARLTTPVGLGDLFPTLCSLAGIPTPDGLDGVDLSASLSQGVEPPDRPIACDSLIPRWGPGTEFRSLRQGRYKYVRFNGLDDLFFDVIADRDEQHNLAATATGEARAALDRLRAEAGKLDFDAVAVLREADQELLQAYPKRFDARPKNVYKLPDGRLIAADRFLYEPVLITRDPEAAIDDYPAVSDAATD